MASVIARVYHSSTLVLLAMDMPYGGTRNDFLGFAVRRTPRFLDLKTNSNEHSGWLPKRLGVDGPAQEGMPDIPSHEAPNQKFMWWDARLEGLTPGQPIKYEVSAVVGNSVHPTLDSNSTTDLVVTLPDHIQFGIGACRRSHAESSTAAISIPHQNSQLLADEEL